MKQFNAWRFFLGLMFLVGLLLYAGISVYVDSLFLSKKLAHLVVQLVLAMPVCLVVTRLRAMRCGLRFIPRPTFRVKLETSPPLSLPGTVNVPPGPFTWLWRHLKKGHPYHPSWSYSYRWWWF